MNILESFHEPSEDLKKGWRNWDLESDGSEWSSHSSVESGGAAVGHDVTEDGDGGAGGGVLLADTKSVEWVTGDDAGNTADSTGDELFTPTAGEKFRPEIHFWEAEYEWLENRREIKVNGCEKFVACTEERDLDLSWNGRFGGYPFPGI